MRGYRERVIESAQEFVRLRSSEKPEEYLRAAREEAQLRVYREVIARFPEFKQWVIYNKPVPLEILSELASDPDTDVRCSLVINAKISDAALELLRDDPFAWIQSKAQKEKDRRLGLSSRD